MKAIFSLHRRQMGKWTACLLLAAALVPQSPAQTPPPAPLDTQVKLTTQELTQLLSPIALYPDALIALILPAATVPSDVVMGARYLAGNGDPVQVANQPWDESVKSLTRYPDVLAWMDQNLDWTASLGEAFMDQPADVMNAIQVLRDQARAAGTLVDTPEQKIVQEEEYIRIVPADPEVIYVPQYDPQIVYVESYTPAVISFGVGFAVGSWLNCDFDWRRRCLYRGNWRGWDRDRGWNNGWRGGGSNTVNVVNIDVNNATVWQPTAASVRQVNQRQRNNNGNARIVNARSQQPQRTAAVNLPAGAQFDPGRVTAVPRPSRLNVRNDRRNDRPDRSDRPTGNRPNTPATGSESPGTVAQTPDDRNSRPPRGQQPPNAASPQPANTPPPSAGGRVGSASSNENRRGNGEVGQETPQGTPPRTEQPRNRPRFDDGPVVLPQGNQTPPPTEGRRRPGANSGQPPRRPTPSTAAPEVNNETPRASQGQRGNRSDRQDRRPASPQVPPPSTPTQVPSQQQPRQVQPQAPRVQQPQQAPQAPRVQQPQQAPQAPRVQQPQQGPRQQQPQEPRQPAPQAPRQQPQVQQPRQMPQQAPQARQERSRSQSSEMRQQQPASRPQMQAPSQNRGGSPAGSGGGRGEGRRQQQQ